MLATLGGTLALLLGLVVLLLPLLATELSRPGDSAWGAVVLLLGLVLVTTAERLSGAPMLAVACGGLLTGRLVSEVGQARWRQLTPEEQQRLWSKERWQTSLAQLGATTARLLVLVTDRARTLTHGWTERRRPRSSGKRWVRPELGPSGDSPPPVQEDEEMPAKATESAAGPGTTGGDPNPLTAGKPRPDAASSPNTNSPPTQEAAAGPAAGSAPAAPAVPSDPAGQEAAAGPGANAPMLVQSFAEIDALLQAVADDTAAGPSEAATAGAAAAADEAPEPAEPSA